MKKYKFWFKALAVVLSVLIGFQVAPVFAVALENDHAYSSTTDTTKKVSPKTSFAPKKTVSEDVLSDLADKDDAEGEDTEAIDDTAEIKAEEVDLRDASVKHFRLEDGRSMAAVYAEPVHFEKNGVWTPIDNTLIRQKSQDGTVSYATTETATPSSFPNTLSEPISVEVRGHTLTMSAKEETVSKDAVAEVVSPDELTSAMLEPAASEEALVETPKSKLADWLADKFSKDNKDEERTSETAKEASLLEVDNKDSAIRYEDALSGADLEYKVTSSQIKEAIVINEKQDDYRYEFTFDAGDLDVLENEDGSVSLIENGDEEHPLFVFAAPFMEDANGESSEEVYMTVEKAERDGLFDTSNTYNLIVKADPSWINDSSRQFPIIIDPTVLLDVGYLNIDDTYVDTASAYHHAYAASLYVGKNSLGTTRTFVRYALPDLPDCSVVVGSKLYLAQRDYDPGSGTKAFIAAYAPSSNWTSTSLLWSNQPGYDATSGAVDFTTFTAGTGSFNYTLDITKIAKSWYEKGQNYGVMLKSYNENVTRRSAFYSTNYTSAAMYPQITLTYVSSTGLESYWNYETVDLGRSGTVSINDYNGAMTYVADDISLSGNTSPMSMSHIYLSDVGSLNEFTDLQTTRYGDGFRTSLMERIKLLSSTADPDLYTAGYRVKLTDVDGTVHYFKKTDTAKHYVYEFDENVVIDEAPANDYIFTLSYEDGSKRLYDSEGYIVGMLDQNNIRYTITPASSNTMTITDGANRTGTLAFNSSGYLTSFTDPAGRVTSYTYSGTKLSRITYPDSKYTDYSYDSTTGLLNGITATDGSSVTFTYKAVTSKGKTFYRVASMTRNGTNSTYNSMTFQYEGDFTIVTTNDGTVNKIVFDNMGRAISIQDQDGNIVTGKYNNGGNKQNTVASGSDSFAVTENFFTNHSFEDGFTDWNVYASGNGCVYGLSNTEVRSGSNSVYLTRTASGGDYLNQDYTNVTAGETYVASGYMKVDGTIEQGNAFIKAEIKSGDTILSTEYSIPYFTTDNEWVRVQVPVTIPSGADRVRVFATIETYGSDTETVYFDCMQFEHEDTAGPYNFLTNPTCDMLDGSGNAIGWTLPTGGSTFTISGPNKCVRLTGAPANSRYASQTISMTGTEGTVLVFGGIGCGYASAESNQSSNDRRFGIKVYLYNGDTAVNSKGYWFNQNTNEIQGLSGSIVAAGDFDRVVYRLIYNQEVNVAAFDDLYLYADNYGTSYSYDSDGKLILQKSDSGDAIRYTYSGPDITKIAFEKNGVEKDNETYTYDNHHNILTSTTQDGIVTTYTYPTTNRGMPTKIEVQDASGNLTSKVEYTYTAYDNYLATTKDENGQVTTYDYNTTKGLLNSVTDPMGNVTSYTYNTNNDDPLTTSGSIDANTNATVSYTYDAQGRVTGISPAGTTYNFTYDQFGRVTGTSVSGNTLSTVAYNSDGTVATSTYGNGTVHAYTYDSMDRVTSESYDGNVAYRYSYNSQGYLGSLEDVAEDDVWVYGYDLAGRLTEEDSMSRTSIRYAYNDQNNTSAYKVYKRGNKVSAADYTYSNVGLLTGVTTNNGDPNFTYGYDGLNRITSEGHALTSGNVATNYTYHSSTQGQSGRIATLSYQKTPTGGSATSMRPGISYQYNANGQITSITENNKTNSYEYDGLGRLTRENDEDRNVTICYNYDSNGNILSKVFYPYTTGTLGSATQTISYTYAVSWGDQLLTYDNGSTILYDQIGNPVSYNGYTFTWQKGRQLASATKNGETFNFTYDADGQRTWKMGSATGEQCIYASGLLVYWTDGENIQKFTYDPDGIALGVNLNGTDYYYLYNAQGDVIALYDSTGTIVTEYVYDSWGKILSVTGSGATTIGALNPIRYRGYFYDTDLGFYLLETRYYDPETGRFINADGVVDNRGVQTTNLYSYCANNPINNKDEDGHLLKEVLIGAGVGAVVGATINGIKAYKKCKGSKKKLSKNDWRTIGKAAGKGALKGAFVGGLVGAFGAHGMTMARTASKLSKVRKVYVARRAVYQGVASFGTHYGTRMASHVKKYAAKINVATTYVPKGSRSASSYSQVKAATQELAKAAIPTAGDWVAGGLGLAVGTVSGQRTAIATGLGTETFTATSLSTDIAEELGTSFTMGGLEEIVSQLYPGEA